MQTVKGDLSCIGLNSSKLDITVHAHNCGTKIAEHTACMSVNAAQKCGPTQIHSGYKFSHKAESDFLDLIVLLGRNAFESEQTLHQ